MDVKGSMMTEQFCVRTYDINDNEVQNSNSEKSNYEVLNSYLDRGWKVVMVTPKPGYNEYIIEREINISQEPW